MSVRQSLLAILDQGPCYGYQLRAEFDRRTGSTWPLNVGQIYNTLERLERDGFVAKGEVDEQGHVYYEITDAGRGEVRAWLDSPVMRPSGTRDELTIKLAVAATLPGVDAADVVRRQRVASRARLAQLRSAHPQSDGADADRAAEEIARELVAEALILQAQAELQWLDHVEARLHPDARFGVELNAEKPRRGRPPRTRDDLDLPIPAAL